MDMSIKQIIKQTIEETLLKTEKATLDVDECVEFSGIGRNKLLELIHSPGSDFPWFRVGAKFLINKKMVIEWLEKVAKEKRVL